MAKITFTSLERKMLKSMRKELSEADLASQIKVSVTTIRRWLDGLNTPPYGTRLLIAKLYKKYKEVK